MLKLIARFARAANEQQKNTNVVAAAANNRWFSKDSEREGGVRRPDRHSMLFVSFLWEGGIMFAVWLRFSNKMLDGF